MYNDYNVIYQTTITDMFWVYLGIAIVILLLLITLYSLSLIFKKASFKQIWAFIPLYNLYKLLEICGLEKINMILIFIPVINIYTMIRIAIELGDCFGRKGKFKALMFFLPFIAYPILAFTKDKYVGINNKRVNGIFIEELKKEEREEVNVSKVIKRDTSIGMGTNTFTRKDNSNSDTNPNELKADVNILNQTNKVENEYIECPKCRYKVKKGTPVCFMCGTKLEN